MLLHAFSDYWAIMYSLHGPGVGEFQNSCLCYYCVVRNEGRFQNRLLSDIQIEGATGEQNLTHIVQMFLYGIVMTSVEDTVLKIGTRSTR
jgi:hypothetical protein